MICSQHNAWIHSAATIMVVAAGFYFHLTKAEWCWIILAIISVWTAEAINTAFEFLTDVASPGVLITTSSFTPPAVEFAKSVERIVLIDGGRLTELMMECGVGVSHRTVKIPKIDTDYFEE